VSGRIKVVATAWSANELRRIADTLEAIVKEILRKAES
jgi:hypothetical protein